MFCTQCGANNADSATVCLQCGRTLQPAPSLSAQPPGIIQTPNVYVPNYLVFAILSTVLCCLPAGIPAIVYAAQINGKLQVRRHVVPFVARSSHFRPSPRQRRLCRKNPQRGDSICGPRGQVPNTTWCISRPGRKARLPAIKSPPA